MDNLSINIDNALWTKQQLNINNIKSNINKVKDDTFEKMLEEKIGKNGKVNINKLSKNEKRLYDSCVEMESFLWKNVLNSMKNTINKFKLIDGGITEEIFSDFLYDEYAMILAKSSSSDLASIMFKQLSRNL